MTALQSLHRHAPRCHTPALERWKPPHDSGFVETARAWFAGALIAAVVLAPGAWSMYKGHTARAEAHRAYRERLSAYTRLAAAPAGPVFDADAVVHGKRLFESACASCHKADGTGMPGLGKDLTRSWFVADADDAGLIRFIEAGRDAADPLNTTKVSMPPKGGRDDLTTPDLAGIVTYVRALQDPRRMPDLPASALAPAPPPAPTDDQLAKALEAAGGDEELAAYIAQGAQVFTATCAACHGKDARGLPKLGVDLVSSELARRLDDEALLAFVKKGRDPGDPASTTGIAMPPRGGNPALSDDDILDVIAYLRSIQPPSAN